VLATLQATWFGFVWLPPSQFARGAWQPAAVVLAAAAALVLLASVWRAAWPARAHDVPED
jgi:hypothetical protein